VVGVGGIEIVYTSLVLHEYVLLCFINEVLTIFSKKKKKKFVLLKMLTEFINM
jgi:hypothetical protein